MDPMMIVAICLVIWTLFLGVATIAAMIVAASIRSSVKRMERRVDELKNQAMPTLIRSQDLMLEFRSVGKEVRKQVRQSEHLVKDTLHNVTETTTRIRDAVTGISLILSALGKIASPFAGGRSNKSKGKD